MSAQQSVETLTFSSAVTVNWDSLDVMLARECSKAETTCAWTMYVEIRLFWLGFGLATHIGRELRLESFTFLVFLLQLLL